MGFFRPAPHEGTLSERLRWVREFHVEQIPITVLAGVLFVVFGIPTWGWLVFGAAALIQVIGFAWLSLRIRQAERSERD